LDNYFNKRVCFFAFPLREALKCVIGQWLVDLSTSSAVFLQVERNGNKQKKLRVKGVIIIVSWTDLDIPVGSWPE
jgi:hypothetical protein